jgi:VanZ family protein
MNGRTDPPAVVRAACLAAAVVLVANLFMLGAQPFAVGLVPPPWDKLAHVAVFAALGALLMAATAGRRRWLVVAAAIAIAAADELFQTTLPGRVVSVADLAANMTGAMAGVAATILAFSGCRGSNAAGRS